MSKIMRYLAGIVILAAVVFAGMRLMKSTAKEAARGGAHAEVTDPSGEVRYSLVVPGGWNAYTHENLPGITLAASGRGVDRIVNDYSAGTPNKASVTALSIVHPESGGIPRKEKFMEVGLAAYDTLLTPEGAAKPDIIADAKGQFGSYRCGKMTSSWISCVWFKGGYWQANMIKADLMAQDGNVDELKSKLYQVLDGLDTIP